MLLQLIITSPYKIKDPAGGSPDWCEGVAFQVSTAPQSLKRHMKRSTRREIGNNAEQRKPPV